MFGSSAEHGIDCRVVGRDRPTVVRVRRAVTRSVVSHSSREENPGAGPSPCLFSRGIELLFVCAFALNV